MGSGNGLRRELHGKQARRAHLPVQAVRALAVDDGPDVLGVGGGRDFQFDAAHVVVGAEGPEMGFLDALDAFQRADLEEENQMLMLSLHVRVHYRPSPWHNPLQKYFQMR